MGLAMVNNLAAQGFNVCIVARNAEKMRGCLAQINRTYPNVETKQVVADFCSLRTLKDYEKVAA